MLLNFMTLGKERNKGSGEFSKKRGESALMYPRVSEYLWNRYQNNVGFPRVHELEELLKDQETSAEQTLEEEVKRHREAYSKYEKEKGTEIELLNTR